MTLHQTHVPPPGQSHDAFHYGDCPPDADERHLDAIGQKVYDTIEGCYCRVQFDVRGLALEIRKTSYASLANKPDMTQAWVLETCGEEDVHAGAREFAAAGKSEGEFWELCRTAWKEAMDQEGHK